MRKVIIMRGLPGCGKSYYTHRYCLENETSVCVVSADTYHYVQQPPNPDGTLLAPKYDFKPENAGEAHNQCLIEFMKALNELYWDTIIVDNTNTTAWEISPYYRLAEVYGREVEIVWLRVPVRECIRRGIHNVPEQVYSQMADTLESERLPKHWKQTIINDI